jgi:hypothetical protein
MMLAVLMAGVYGIWKYGGKKKPADISKKPA